MSHSGHKLEPSAFRIGVPISEHVAQFLRRSPDSIDVVVLANHKQHSRILLCDLTGSLHEIEPRRDLP